MLTAQTIAIVKSTAPILAEHGETLTKHFYKRMFAHNPEVAPFFNAAHQEQGKQQRALANAIAAYAANIDNLSVLGSAVELIAQKHASLLIQKEHYPIVGENLLASIQDVLGDAATDDIINAWGQAYGFLADILINREAQIYADNKKKSGGWEGFKKFRVVRKEPESSVITSFYLVPVDGVPLPIFSPGQYITLRVKTPSGQTTMRNYSLSDKPAQDWFRISVKRENGVKAGTPDGYVSNLLHNNTDVGDLLDVAPPCGDFVLDPQASPSQPLVLLAGGVGITPLMSMLLSALSTTPERPITLVYAAQSEKTQAFRSFLDILSQRHPQLSVHHRYMETPTTTAPRVSSGLIDAAFLNSLIPSEDAAYYICGPKPFMDSIYTYLSHSGIPSAHLHVEFFGPLQALTQSR